MIGWIVRLASGGIIERFTGPLLEAHRQRLQAQNNAERVAAEQEIARLEAARDIALAEQHDRWSATRIGRLLIVIPFGCWWSAIYLVQILNPWFGLELVVIDVPRHIHDMALILIPAIIIGDAGALVARRIRR